MDSKTKIPKHVAIILDGNRRFAKKLGFRVERGHELGSKKAEELLEWCREIGIKELTLYCLSLENFNRMKREFAFLMSLFKKQFEKLGKDERIHKNKVKIKFIGRLKLLPQNLQKLMNEIMDSTKRYNNYRLNFAIAYSGRAEIIDAINNIIEKIKKKEKIKKINENLFSKELYLSSEPDLLIRTAGEKRISNFLLWQSSYSELVFSEKLWPEFSKKDFLECIEEYSRRERRFGR